jgi:hypothetical protein
MTLSPRTISTATLYNQWHLVLPFATAKTARGSHAYSRAGDFRTLSRVFIARIP